MIYKEPTIYKQGLQPSPKDGFIYVQQNGTWKEFSNIIASSWVEINNKIGHIYQPSQSGRVSFRYNKNLALIMLFAWIDYGQDITSNMSTIFEFNNDLPGTQDNKIFSGSCPALTNSDGYGAGFGTVRIIPNSDSDANISQKITYQKFQANGFRNIQGFNELFSINSSLLDAFNSYLE